MGSAIALREDFDSTALRRFARTTRSALAQETAPGVVVVAVNPGVVATDMLATCFEGATGGATPPEECAAAFVRMLEQLGPSWNGRSVDLAGL